jgi:purine-binding chemotaxis protein CheW
MTAPIDWDRIKRRLAAVGDALTRDRGTDIEERRAMLEARAHALAARAASAREDEPGLQVVEFVLGAGTFAIDAWAVREVRTLTELTALPCTPPFVSGIINAHGRIIPVIDLKKFMSLPESGLTDLNKVIILHHADVDLGILADRILGAGTVAVPTIRPAPTGPDGRPLRHLRGITAQQTLLLDAAGLLSDPALVVDDEVSA